MSNPQQNETEQFKRDINLLQDKLKRLKKQSLLQNGKKKIAKTQNGPKQIAKMKNGQNETKQIERKINLLRDKLEQFKKNRAYWKKD